MIQWQELRPGNTILAKQQHRIVPVQVTAAHYALGLKEPASFFPIVLKAEWLQRCGFTENKDYPLAPAAREFVRVLPVMGKDANELRAYIKNNGECFARATVNGLVVSNNVFHLHSLQNLYFALTGEELAV
ncbi:MAG TPA: hypothetical protein VHK69_16345 [Chitinophagaceae bacterium]|jgi:hypothetical protein|nr:hypothetical protein [Chitinophagaceae bacterium]